MFGLIYSMANKMFGLILFQGKEDVWTNTILGQRRCLD